MAQRQSPISRGMNLFRPAAMAANGTIEVCAANGSQLLPKSRRRFASIDTVPARATIAQVAKKTRDATSPLPIRCTSAQRPTPVRNGWRVIRTIPCGGSPTRPSCATEVGFGVIKTDDDQQRGWEHQNDGNRLPPFEHSPRDKVGGSIVSRHEPSEPDYRSRREGAPIAVFAQYPDRSVAHRSAGDAKMNTGEEERSQDQ